MSTEYIPVAAYGLLRRIIGQGLQRVRRDHLGEDESARYLVSRGLAQANALGSRIENTPAALVVGLVECPPTDFA